MRIEGILLLVVGIILGYVLWRSVHFAVGLVIGAPFVIVGLIALHGGVKMSRGGL